MASADFSPHPDAPLNCLLVYPRFPESAYWNWTEVCSAVGRKAMGIPLGLLTFAATLPPQWNVRLVDLNTTDWDEQAWEWADLVAVGGMMVQQRGMFEVIERARQAGKFVIVGGPDATSQPALYQAADALLLGEAETTVPQWLAACRAGHPGGTFQALEQPDVSQSPLPRFDLLKIEDYLSVNVQFSRGCPFNCEFCDVIELYGRTPRTKTPAQFCRELEALYDLGYRGWVDVVDDNFVGNKSRVKELLPVLKEWCERHAFPFYFSTQASINLADDEPLMDAMTDVDFRTVFIGIETPDAKLLATTQKRMNVLKPIRERLGRIYERGLSVTAGFILGFDGESPGAGDVIRACIEENDIPIAMVSLLAALPNTQLSRRLAREGRLLNAATCEPLLPGERHEVVLPMVQGQLADQAALGGLKFTTTRDRYQIMEEHRQVWQAVYEPRQYFARVFRAARRIRIRRKHRLPRRQQRKLDRGFLIMMVRLSQLADVRWPLWWLLLRAPFLGLARFEYVAQMAIAYAQFRKILRRIEKGLPERIAAEQQRGVLAVCPPVGATAVADQPRRLEEAAL